MLHTRLLLIEDHALFRLGVKLFLNEAMPEVEILQADTLEHAMHICLEPPALVLLDIQLRGVNGLEGLGPLKSRWPGVPVIMLSAESEPESVRLALERGATAFLSKTESTPQILKAIQTALGSRSDSPFKPAAVTANAPLKTNLTPRQCEILDLLVEGLSNKGIARRLAISEFTVRGHVQNVLGLLQVSSRAQALIAARRIGLLK